jgi:ribosomal protein L40E
MYDLAQIETKALRLCQACEAELQERDKFCRRCGARQSGPLAASHVIGQPHGTEELAHDSRPAPYATAPLPPIESPRSFSGALAQAIAASVAANAAQHIQHRCAQKLLLALISLPIWLIIILLSPLDAYLAAKAAVQRV